MPPTPVTIVTGFLGSGKTTLILNLIPQLPKAYKLALLKNEFGDVEIDSQLASSAAISGVKELLNGCICCNLVGQLGDALETLRRDVHPDRIVIETSGSAFPATLAMEVNRLGRETGVYVLDGVIVVIDVENWQGYDDTSYTAKMQARYTDLIVFNKWEVVDERRYDDCLDRVGDLEIEVAKVKSDKGRVDKDVLLGLDSALAKDIAASLSNGQGQHHNHQSEVEVLSVTLSRAEDSNGTVDLDSLEVFLTSAPKDEIYRIKAVLRAAREPRSSDEIAPRVEERPESSPFLYILNWAFGRWTFSPLNATGAIAGSPSALHGKDSKNDESTKLSPIVRMTIILARYESTKWTKKLQAKSWIKLDGVQRSILDVKRMV